MILASHQPDFLPYSGFFYKVAKADIFDLAIYDQYSHQGYQRRVKMGGEWVSLVVNKDLNDRKPIWAVEYDREKSFDRIMTAIKQNYEGAPYYTRIAPMIAFEIAQGNGNLCDLNIKLISMICAILGIQTRVATAMPLTKPKGHGILQLMDVYEADTYLSGVGAKEYIGNEFEKAGKKLEWSKHLPHTGNSILEIIMNYDNPMDYIMAEQEDE